MNGRQRLFLPWVRRGLSGALEAPSGNDLPARAAITAEIEIAAGPDRASARTRGPLAVRDIALLGPGDVGALGHEAVLRTEPPDGTRDFFPNQMPSVELAAIDLPWMFTPAGPGAFDRLQPWLVLVCLEARPGVTLAPSPEGLAVLTLDATGDDPDLVVAGPGGQLPDPGEAWAWAHAQLTGVEPPATEEEGFVDRFVSQFPGRALSRLVCPRNLKPSRDYLCAIVPLFEAGRRAGLGLPVEGASGYAWTHDTELRKVELPVYHHWQFATTNEGDFESLARLIKPAPDVDGLGLRTLDTQRPGFAVETTAVVIRSPANELTESDIKTLATPLPFPVVAVAEHPATELEAALRPAGRRGADEGTFADALVRTLLAGEGQGDPPNAPPVVGAPLYGRWHAGFERRSLPEPGASSAWLRALNASVATRAVAGAGVAIVRRHQERLVADAWSQYGAIEQINDVLTRGQLARATGRRLYRRHLEIDTRACGIGGAPDDAFLDDALLEDVGPASGRVTVDEGRTVRGALAATPFSVMTRRAFSRAARGAPLADGPAGARQKQDALRARATLLAKGVPVSAGAREDGLPQGALRLDQIDDPSLDAVRGILRDAEGMAVPPPLPSEPDWTDVADALCRGLDPELTVRTRVHARLSGPARAALPDRDELHPIVVSPRFPRPAYLDLKALSQEWMLAGLDRVPRNAIVLLETNPRFVEAHMAGLNHEINAELLYRGFPTDRTGTPFRTFWDRRGAIGDAAEDVPEMTDWTGDLGDHLGGGGGPGLVLLLRGDLLKRFPNTIIYAARAKRDGGETTVDDDVVRMPVFRGTLEPDVTFLGFDLTLEQARSDPGADDPGWFFVIEGQPVEPSFGLGETLDYDDDDYARPLGTAVPSSPDDLVDTDGWDDIYWGDLAAADAGADPAARRAALAGISHVPIDPPNPRLNPPAGAAEPGYNEAGVSWGRNAAHMAYITLQLDTRLAYHADALLEGIAS